MNHVVSSLLIDKQKLIIQQIHMKGIQICPTCGQPTLKIKEETVQSLLKEPSKITREKGKWQACVNENCETVYIKNELIVKKDEIKSVLFFKDKTDDAVICYCYKITKGDIKQAVQHGCSTTGEVYKYLKSSKKGSCSTNNPLGKSCSNVFKYTLNELIKQSEIVHKR